MCSCCFGYDTGSLSRTDANLLQQVLHTETSEAEPAYRALVALGNTIHGLKSTGSSLESIQSSDISKLLRPLPTTFKSDARVQNIVREITALL